MGPLVPGKGVFGLTGKIGCSGIQTDSKPNPSAVRAKAAGFAVYPVNGISSPIFITDLLFSTETTRRFRRLKAIQQGGEPSAVLVSLPWGSSLAGSENRARDFARRLS